MRGATTLAVSTFLGMTTTASAAPTLEIDPSGKIATTYAQFNWALKDLGGKKTHPVNPIVEVQYKGAVLPASDYAANIMGGEKGNIQILKPVVPPGKHKVKLKVRLDDNSVVEKEAEVDFKIDPLEPPPPPPPPPEE